MKKMKTLMMILVVFAYGYSVQAQQPVNSMAVAISLVEKPIVEYEFYYHCVDGNGDRVVMKGTQNLKGWITSLKKDNVIILEKGEKPLPGIPYLEGASAVRSVGVSLEGKTATEGWVGYGYAQYDVLYLGDHIIIDFDPTEGFRKVIDIEGESGDVLYIDGEQSGYYSEYYHGFYTYFDLSESYGEHTYQIYNDDGELVDAGYLNQFLDLVVADGEKYTTQGVRIIGGVIELNEYTSRNFGFDSNIYSEDGTSESSKIFVIEVPDGGYLQIDNFETAVLSYRYNGQTIPIANYQEYTWVSLPKTDKKLILVVYGDKKEQMYLYFRPNTVTSLNSGGGQG
jgi:hypothetical protein